MCSPGDKREWIDWVIGDRRLLFLLVEKLLGVVFEKRPRILHEKSADAKGRWPASLLRLFEMGWLRGLSRRRGRVVAAITCPLVVLAFIVLAQPLWAFSVLGRVFPDMLFRVETDARVVALSFDDGPDDVHTARVLEILAKHGAHATFFMIGDRAVGRLEIVRSVREAGHEVGNHYFTIGSAVHAREDRFLGDVLRAEKALGLADVSPRLFRPPSGEFTQAQLDILKARGYRAVLGSVYPFDTSRPPVAYIRWMVSRNLAPGVIVILHDGVRDPTNMLTALDEILDEGTQRGFRFVSVGELLKLESAKK
jgi:peptidoglycan/xylan/chitin deacetylase (PgdA/CDA1 family)